jgi:AraC family transcriptional regulator of adaptative response/methylated-DNA-[protein]-cysteine methyltransferase
MDLAPISRALLHAAEHYQEQPSLEALARVAGLSPAHFQRRFQAAVGISPKRFVAQLSARQAAGALRGGRSVLDAALDAGLSGPGRLHDLMLSVEGATPGEVASGGEGLVLKTGVVATPCGLVYGAVATRGLCWAAFADGAASLREAETGLKQLWPKARLQKDDAAVAAALAPFWRHRGKVQLWVRGTPFQLQVWRALMRLPAGRTLSYQALGKAAGVRGARAIGSAVARNPVALLIPCHRVIQASGAVGQYHWGPARKRALLALEAAQAAEKKGNG